MIPKGYAKTWTWCVLENVSALPTRVLHKTSVCATEVHCWGSTGPLSEMTHYWNLIELFLFITSILYKVSIKRFKCIFFFQKFTSLTQHVTVLVFPDRPTELEMTVHLRATITHPDTHYSLLTQLCCLLISVHTHKFSQVSWLAQISQVAGLPERIQCGFKSKPKKKKSANSKHNLKALDCLLLIKRIGHLDQLIKHTLVWLGGIFGKDLLI